MVQVTMPKPHIVPCLPFPGLPRDLEFFMFAVMKTFITDISASTGRNDFIFDICAVNLEREDMVQVTMPKPHIKYKIISSSRS
jgi:hypothetical protein